MALTQSALRLPGPSWDEEVVPALRKRLESESRTLSKRMSAISLSGDEVMVGGTYSAYNGSSPISTRQHTATYSSDKHQTNGRDSFDSEYASGSGTYTSRYPNTAKRPPAIITAANGTSASTSFQRSRTYSQPEGVKMNHQANGSTSSHAKPTRIPKPSKTCPNYSNGNTPVVPQTNGFLSNSPPLEDHHGSSHFPPSSTSKSLGGLAGLQNLNRSASGLLNESPPFPPSSSASSLDSRPAMNGYHHNEVEERGFLDAAPSRQSMESEEQPFEHWYRGEVSRNGGVGELRVGRRQEMLDIANYGHMMRNQAKRKVPPPSVHNSSGRRRHRKRAGSIGRLTDAERVRESVYFDEEGMQGVSRVLDEHPLTDLEDEALQSDVASLSSFHRVEHDHIPGVGDISTTSVMAAVTPNPEDEEVTTPRITEDRSTTPTPLSNSQHGHYPPTRIPGPSRPRKSSEHRSATPTQNASARSGLNVSTSTTSTTKTASTFPMATSGSRSVSGQSLPPSQSGAANRRGVSPAPPNKRKPVKSLKGKQTPVRLPQKGKRESVGQYPSVENEGDLADAIPTWTQPVPKSGNWDEVVLPVVARNKGMDGYYKTADGSPQPRKPVDDRIEPAPGTFGIKEWKNRAERGGDEFIPLDKFGQPEQDMDESERQPPDEQQFDQQHRPDWPPQDSYNKHEQTVLPVRGDPPPSPPPFAAYAPHRGKAKAEADLSTALNGAAVADNGSRQNESNRDEEGAGCCKCSIM